MDWKKLLNHGRIRTSERKADARNEFESDFGRIIFSPAVRRMHDKTQVFPLTTDDNIHSRLTHSLEVMSIGYSLGVRICGDKKMQQFFSMEESELIRKIPIILKNICLVHDIGNPPFGHFGETVIQNYFKELFTKENPKEEKRIELDEEQKRDFIKFDGNAQGLRVLTKLQSLNDDKGLNLTFATLASYIKYPNYGDSDKNNLAKKKTGVFYSEKEYFEKIMDECGLKDDKGEFIRHPLCYLMEAADSICYLVMDIEDAYSKGIITLGEFYDYLKDVPSVKDKLTSIYKDKEKYKNDITKIVNFRIVLIQSLVDLAYNNFVEKIDEIMKGNYNEELIFDDKNDLAKKLNQISKEKIFPFREINSLEITGHSVITGLLDYYIYFLFHTEEKYRKKAERLISSSIKRAVLLENNKENIDCLDDYYKLKIIVDFISGMTDQYALDHYQKINGQKIS